MLCPSCRHDGPDNSRFCLECGTLLAADCPHCGAGLPPGARFCNRCGSALSGRSTEKLVASASPLESERKLVTVLFADVKGSTELIAERDPEEAQKILDPVVERMIEAVHHYEGTVSRVMGDGIMALFGAPRAVEDHAVRACYAALRMQESVRRQTEAAGGSGIDIQIRVGLHSGPVVVRAIGNDFFMDYTAVGETTHVAARMEQIAAPGTTYLTADTLRLVEGYVTVKPLGLLGVKGIPDPVEVYEALGPGAARTRFQAVSVAHGLVKFVGREREIGELERALALAREGSGQIVAVVGEAGVGKSRLSYELTRSPRAQGWTVLETAALPYGKATSYQPLIALLKAYFQIGERDDHAAIQQKLTTKLAALEGTLEPTLTPLLALLDVPLGGEWRALDPPRRRQRTLEALRSLLLRESQAQPLLLVFEDLHWIDAETQALLDGLVETLPSASLLLLVSYRPEYTHDWGDRAQYTELRIAPLPPPTAEELLHALLGEDPSTEPLKPLLAERAAGNPLFLEECVRSLAESGALSGDRGAYHLVDALDALEVPATLHAILASRIDRLPPAEKQLLQLAAVIGKDVPFRLLREASGGTEQALRSGLSRLQAAELLYESKLFPDLEFTFKHSLTHDVAYGGILHERRRAIHGAFVETIEALYSDRLSEHFERLAYHALGGELWEKAVTYFQRAARKAGARSAYREAAVCYDQAVAALAHLPENRERLEQGFDLRFEANFIVTPLGELSRAVHLLSDAEPLAEALGDRHRLARLLAQKGVCLWAQGRFDRALECARQALDIALALGDRSSQIDAGYALGMVQYTLGDFAAAIDVLENALSLLGQERFSARFHTFYAAGLRIGLAFPLCHLGRLREGFASVDEALRLAEATGDSHLLSMAHTALGFLHLQRGEFETAIAKLERGIEICERAALAITRTALSVDLGRSYAYCGRADEGARLIEQALRRAGTEIELYAGEWQTHYAEACLRAGRREDARRIAAYALDLSRERSQRGAEAQCLHLLGDLAGSEEPVDLPTAQAHYRDAAERAQALGMRPLLARCHLSLGRVERGAGRRAAARRHFETAAALYGEMDIRFWLDAAEAEIRATA